MDITPLLQKIPLFSHFGQEELAALSQRLPVLRLACGEALVEQGEASEQAYVLLEGRLEAHARSSHGQVTRLGEIGKGEVVGEAAALLGQARNATVKAVRESLLVEIDRATLLESIQRQQSSLLDFSRTLLRRNQPLFRYQDSTGSVLVFPISKGVDAGAFCQRLQQSASQLVRAEEMSPDSLGAPVGSSDNLEREYGARIEAGTDACDLLLLPSKGELNAWTSACARRTDRVLLVGHADDSAQPSASERAFVELLKQCNGAKVELVLLHPTASRRPQGTSAWLSERSVFRHHHLALDRATDFDRVARFITGRAIGLALSGGGFKASVQGGILHALREGGLPIDLIGGSSGGALAGAHFAMLPEFDRMRQEMKEINAAFKKSAQLTFPAVSLFSGKNFTRGFQKAFGDLGVEDLWINYFCLSLSLVSGELRVHREGPLWEAVRASSSVMGLFPPVIQQGDCLVDGGFINPCPTDLLHEMGAGKVVVVSAFGKAGIEVDHEYGPDVSGWRLLARRLNPFAKGRAVPSLTTSIVQSMLMASTHLLAGVFERSNIDLLIEPDLSQYTARDQSVVEELYAFGYEYGQQHVADWKAQLGL